MGTKYVRSYVVESLGEIMLFWVFWSDISGVNEFIMDVRAYRLDSKMRWEEVKDLGNRTFFFYPEIKEFGCCVSGSRFPKNNIYFISEEGDNIVRYNYGDHSITTVMICEEGCKILGLVI
ncbi:hypothetical protein LINGRAHAP2_LOCUS21909 [Linum grandiflorum]